MPRDPIGQPVTISQLLPVLNSSIGNLVEIEVGHEPGAHEGHLLSTAAAADRDGPIEYTAWHPLLKQRNVSGGQSIDWSAAD
jgi:hypothetical protein